MGSKRRVELVGFAITRALAAALELAALKALEFSLGALLEAQPTHRGGEKRRTNAQRTNLSVFHTDSSSNPVLRAGEFRVPFRFMLITSSHHSKSGTA